MRYVAYAANYGAAATCSLSRERGLFGLLANLRAGSSPKSGYGGGNAMPCL